MTLPHPHVAALRDALVDTVKELAEVDSRLNFGDVDAAFSLAWVDIEKLFTPPDPDEAGDHMLHMMRDDAQ